MPPLLATPAVVSAYRAAGAAQSAANPAAEPAGQGFGSFLQRAVQGAIQQGHAADTTSTQALTGQAGVTEVVLAVGKAELALQTVVAVRDRVVAAYQEVMRMPI